MGVEEEMRSKHKFSTYMIGGVISPLAHTFIEKEQI